MDTVAFGLMVSQLWGHNGSLGKFILLSLTWGLNFCACSWNSSKSNSHLVTSMFYPQRFFHSFLCTQETRQEAPNTDMCLEIEILKQKYRFVFLHLPSYEKSDSVTLWYWYSFCIWNWALLRDIAHAVKIKRHFVGLNLLVTIHQPVCPPRNK